MSLRVNLYALEHRRAGYGTVFQLRSTGTGGWDFRTLYEFQGAPDGSFLYGALLFVQAGHIYGTTYYGGADGLGSIYRLARTNRWQLERASPLRFKGQDCGKSAITPRLLSRGT